MRPPPGRPTAILAYELDCAVPCLLGAAEAGLSVPGDLSLMMFHRTIDQVTGRAISAMIHNMGDLGCEAARMLIEKIRSPDLPIPPRAIPARLLAGTTCAPPKC
jgi:DNA-binding LacI/PurR family transcriptional regulator